ncbi:hypothetical protein EX30DRAFT_158753 [Ascodesmis nigricans]|uniref:Yeast cell wall synthesis Kre9/Knh1-like N-terminal domain-containing protein n=1 Tax=Ascodesmis nigricans TaxID=341454 RepID=A0A4S2MRB6_9PEZI|nr:hypothetical protein EX30DRAFT_158753 [Ascodesmis nigricans]
MKFTFFAGAVASLAALVAASADLYPKGELLAGQNAVLSPNTKEPVTAGSPFTITWETGNVEGTISLVLLKGPAVNIIPQFAIAQSIPNTGSYTWDVPADLEATETTEAGYGIRIDIDATGNYQYSTQFGVIGGAVAPGPAVVSSSVAAPVVSAPAEAGKTKKVVYSTETVTATSCHCTKSKPVPTGGAAPSGSPVKNGTVPAVPTYVKPTTVPSKVPEEFTGAAGKIQVGGAAFVVMMASLVALF